MACADLDHEEHVQAPQRDRAVHVKEAAGQHCRGLGAQELPLCGAVASRCGLIFSRFRIRRTVDAPAR